MATGRSLDFSLHLFEEPWCARRRLEAESRLQGALEAIWSKPHFMDGESKGQKKDKAARATQGWSWA